MNWFNDMKVKTKLLTSFICLATVAGIIGAVAYTQIGTITAADEMMYEYMTVPIADLGEISYRVQGTAATLYSLLLSTNAQEDERFYSQIENHQAAIDAKMVSFEKTIREQSIRDAFTKFSEARASYTPQLHKIIEMAQAGKKKEAYEFAKSDVAPIRKVMMEDLDKLVELKRTRAKETIDSNLQLGHSATVTMVTILCIAIGLALLLGVFISAAISRPLRVLADKAHEISAGDLTIAITHDSKDEIGQLSAAFREMVAGLRDTIVRVGEASASVASASSQISSSTEELAAGTQEQTSQAGEVASAVEEMAKTIVENSKNASETASTAKRAREAAELGGKVVTETIEGMKRISEVVNKSADTVKALGKSSDQIGEIIGVIDDIADQTNLLALNAAIEAARAGEQGRGFAVVADEVRKLAERTTKATKEIAGMIKRIQGETVGAVQSMEEGTAKVADGIALADKAGDSLNEIVGISQQVTDMISQIAVASEEQSTASEQISKNVEAISSVTNQSASGTQQIARAAEDLNRLTENLQQLITMFKVDADPHVPENTRNQNARLSSRPSSVVVRPNGKLERHKEKV